MDGKSSKSLQRKKKEMKMNTGNTHRQQGEFQEWMIQGGRGVSGGIIEYSNGIFGLFSYDAKLVSTSPFLHLLFLLTFILEGSER